MSPRFANSARFPGLAQATSNRDRRSEYQDLAKRFGAKNEDMKGPTPGTSGIDFFVNKVSGNAFDAWLQRRQCPIACGKCLEHIRVDVLGDLFGGTVRDGKVGSIAVSTAEAEKLNLSFWTVRRPIRVEQVGMPRIVPDPDAATVAITPVPDTPPVPTA
jgi:hypothetical protein